MVLVREVGTGAGAEERRVTASRGAGAIPLLYISRYSAPIFLCASVPLCLLFRLFSRLCVSTSLRPMSSSRRLCGDRPHRRAWPTTQYVARGRHVTDERSAPPECLRCSIPRGDGIALAAVPVEAHPDRRLLAGGKLRRPALHPRQATSLCASRRCALFAGQGHASAVVRFVIAGGDGPHPGSLRAPAASRPRGGPQPCRRWRNAACRQHAHHGNGTTR